MNAVYAIMQARKVAGIEDSEEEKAIGHATGLRVFGKLKRLIHKTKSNVRQAFIRVSEQCHLCKMYPALLSVSIRYMLIYLLQIDHDNSGSVTPAELHECRSSVAL